MILTQTAGNVTGLVKAAIWSMEVAGTYDGESFNFTQDMLDGKINTVTARRTSAKGKAATEFEGRYTNNQGGSGSVSFSKKKPKTAKKEKKAAAPAASAGQGQDVQDQVTRLV
jgi:hypothetical protein